MIKWLLATLILLVQEGVSFNALLLKTHEHVYSVWAIHILFAICTAIDIAVGFWIGKYAQKKWENGKLVRYGKRFGNWFEKVIGKRGKVISLLLLGTFSMPYINAFIASWLEISFVEQFAYLFIGNIVTYVIGWYIVIGVASVFPNANLALSVVVVLTIVIILLVRRFRIKRV